MLSGQFGVVESALYSPVPGKIIKVAIKKTIDVSLLYIGRTKIMNLNGLASQRSLIMIKINFLLSSLKYT